MPLSLRQTVPPTQIALSLSQIRQHLRLDADFVEEDTLLLLYAQAAQDYVERFTRRQLLTATFVLAVDGFPMCGVLGLPRPPLQSITSVEYLDSAGGLQTLDPSVYGVDTLSEPGRLYVRQGQSWPATLAEIHAVTITYVAGWATYAQVPATLQMALLLLIGHCYEHREATVEKSLTEIPLGITALLWQQRSEGL